MQNNRIGNGHSSTERLYGAGWGNGACRRRKQRQFPPALTADSHGKNFINLFSRGGIYRHIFKSVCSTIRLIDVLWIEAATGRVAAAFEVEHTTSIYSGIVRMLDLALGLPAQPAHALFLVAPDAREGDVRNQLLRPAFSRVADMNVRFIAYSDLERHRENIARFGQGMKAIEAIARQLK